VKLYSLVPGLRRPEERQGGRGVEAGRAVLCISKGERERQLGGAGEDKRRSERALNYSLQTWERSRADEITYRTKYRSNHRYRAAARPNVSLRIRIRLLYMGLIPLFFCISIWAVVRNLNLVHTSGPVNDKAA
jgi:hypothetical protein